MRNSFPNRSCTNILIMKGMLQIVSCVLLLAGLATTTPVGDCPPADPEDFHMPDDSDCTIFYKCAHGVPVKFDCPQPLQFNPKISVCDWPENVQCGAGSGSETTAAPETEPPTCSCTCTEPTTTGRPSTVTIATTTTTRPATTTTVPATTTTVPATTTTVPATTTTVPATTTTVPATTTTVPATTTTVPATTTTVAPDTTTTTILPTTPSRTTPTRPTTVAPTTAAVCDAIGTCPVYTQDSLVVHLPHRTKCDVYCRCNHGVPIEMPCAPGTWFNAALQVCDWPAASGCVPGQGPQPTETTEPSPATTKPTTAVPTTTSEAAPTTTTEAAPARPRCDAVGVCPIYDENSIVVHLPHRTRCDVYCRCNHGEPLEMPCPAGTFFNAKLEVCDWPEDSGCTPGSGSSLI